MGDFHKAFEAIDENHSGKITVNELQNYMMKNNYKQTFVTKWLTLFDVDNNGIITYKHYCETLGLVPKVIESVRVEPSAVEVKEETINVTVDTKESMEVIEEEKAAPNDTLLPCVTTVNNDVAMVETMEVKHTDASTCKVTENNTQKTVQSKIIEIYKQSVNDDVVMEETVLRKKSKKISSDGKQSVKSKIDKTFKSVPKILKASDIKKDEASVRKASESIESKVTESTPDCTKRQPRNPQSYPIQVKEKAPHRRTKAFSKHKRHLRKSIESGVILILLAGSNKGKRVIFLKSLSSGLLLVSGPFSINGCPLRRVHQKMVIATKTRIDISHVNIPEDIDDAFFARESSKRQANTDVSSIFAKTKKEYVLKEERKQHQKEVDKQLIEAIKSREDRKIMVKYLKSMFSLSSHDCPHKMEF